MVVDYPPLASLLAFWAAQCKIGGLPPRSAFAPELLRPWLGHIGILDVEREPLRFRIRLAGTHIVDYFGRDCRGLYLDEIVDVADHASILDVYARCVRTREPQLDASYSHIRSIAGHFVQRLALPVTLTGREVDQIVVGFYAERVKPEQAREAGAGLGSIPSLIKAG